MGFRAANSLIDKCPNAVWTSTQLPPAYDYRSRSLYYYQKKSPPPPRMVAMLSWQLAVNRAVGGDRYRNSTLPESDWRNDECGVLPWPVGPEGDRIRLLGSGPDQQPYASWIKGGTGLNPFLDSLQVPRLG